MIDHIDDHMEEHLAEKARMEAEARAKEEAEQAIDHLRYQADRDNDNFDRIRRERGTLAARRRQIKEDLAAAAASGIAEYLRSMTGARRCGSTAEVKKVDYRTLEVRADLDGVGKTYFNVTVTEGQ